MTKAAVWTIRVLWVLLPAALGSSLADALDGRSTAVRVTLEALLWAGWGVGLVAALVPRTVSLTVLRLAAALAAGVAVWAAVAAEVDAGVVVGLMTVAATLLVVFSSLVGLAFVDASSYGPERRVPLRPPAALLFGPVELATVVVGAGLVSGPLLLAARQWLPGAVLLILGLPAAAAAAHSLHGLSRRWLVLVPGGIVLHDALTLRDPVLFPKEALISVTAAEEGSEALDLTQRAAGLAIEIRIAEPGHVVLAGSRRDEGEIIETDAVLVTPSRPGDLVAEVESRY